MSENVLDQAKTLHASLVKIMEQNGAESIQDLLAAAEFVDLLSVLQVKATEEDVKADIEAMQAIVTPPSTSMLFPAISSLSSLSQKPPAKEDNDSEIIVDPPPKPRIKRGKISAVIKPAPSISRSSPMDEPVKIEPDTGEILHEVRYRAPWTSAQDKMLLEGHGRGLTGRPLAYFVGGFHSSTACSSRLKRLQSTMEDMEEENTR